MDTTTTATVTGWPHLYTPGSAEAPVLLMLHGTGGNEHEIAALAAELDPGAGVLAPRGRVAEAGMLRWFRRNGEGVFDVDDVIIRAGELAGFVDAARGHYGLGGRRLVAVGFSNGANIAGSMLLLGCPVPLEAILIRAMVPLVPERLPKLAGRRVLILAGKVDPMSPPDQPKKMVQMLRGAGADATLKFNDAGHDLTPGDIAAAREWLG